MMLKGMQFGYELWMINMRKKKYIFCLSCGCDTSVMERPIKSIRFKGIFCDLGCFLMMTKKEE